MCCRKKPPPATPVERRLLSFTVNDYPSSINDLYGCNNDGKQIKETFLAYWPDFDVKRFIDSQAKVATFKSEASSAIAALDPGATVLVLADSCFSGDVTRLLKSSHPVRNRFWIEPGAPVIPVMRTFVAKGDIRWIVMSACGETQYAADAYIEGDYHGAFTYYACKTLQPGMTYSQWFMAIRSYLNGTNYEQIPTIEGPAELLERKVFEEQTLVIHNSTHGTQLTGIGDEPIDEAICLFDGNLRDKDYYALLNKII